jgi:protein-S-isoprenylcysteine O-methyltransferase Ste14
MTWSLVRAIVVLPGTVLVFAPSIILWLTRETSAAASMAGFDQAAFWLAAVAAAAGMWLAVWTMRLFTQFGDGTPAPWEPTARLVVRGPYRHVRNPMISGVLLVQLAEALVLHSWPLAAWTAFFSAAHAVYIPLSEEKGLEKRFGEDYRVYKANVPRLIPRLRAWPGP